MNFLSGILIIVLFLLLPACGSRGSGCRQGNGQLACNAGPAQPRGPATYTLEPDTGMFSAGGPPLNSTSFLLEDSTLGNDGITQTAPSVSAAQGGSYVAK